jgi:hypothetical protein
MFKPKSAIPSLTAAALPLFGCGGDADSRGFPEGVNNFCLKIAECYTDTAQECLDTFEPFREYYDNISDACFNLIGTYYQCLADLSCDEYMNSTGDQLEALCYADLEDMWAEVCP